MKIRMIDVAKKAGVSKSTVSQYINGRYEFMSKVTLEKIKSVISELNYRPNSIARSLKVKKTNTIGVIVPNINSVFFLESIKGIEEECLKKGYNLFLCNTDKNIKKEIEYIEMLENRQVDGILISYSDLNREFMKNTSQKDTPIVLFGKDISNIELPIVTSQNRSGVSKGIDHFISLGYTDIGIISTELKDQSFRINRIKGYEDSLEKKYIPYDPEKVFFLEENKDFFEQIEKIFKNKKLPRAIFLCNYKLTLAFIKFCKKYKVSIPKDVAIISFDEILNVDFFEVPISVIKEKAFDIGVRATNILFETIDNKKDSKNIREYFTCDLILRESCDY